MKLIIKNSFLGKHVYDETGKEVCQISSHVMNPNQNILLIEQQKTYISSFERAGSNTALLLTGDEQGSKEHVVKGEANGNSEVKLYERSFHDLNVEDQRQNRHLDHESCAHNASPQNYRWLHPLRPVSYTNLDVYKRQDFHHTVK